MEELFIWTYTIARRPKGVPQQDDMWLSENFQPGKIPEGLTNSWMRFMHQESEFPPKEESLKLPAELYFIVQKQTELLFDCLNYIHDLFIVSESFLNFLEENGMRGHFEICSLNVVHRNQSELNVEKKYYAIRFGMYDDEKFEFPEETRKRASGAKGKFIYPDIRLKQTSDQQLFNLAESFCYRETLIFTKKIKDDIKRKFYKPEIYKATDYATVYNNFTRPEELPEPV